MTDETRAELRRLVTLLVSAADTIAEQVDARAFVDVFTYEQMPSSWGRDMVDRTEVRGLVAVERPTGSAAKAPPLTTAQQLALSVLLGDESMLPEALADYLLDKGHEYAVAVAEKARREECERIVKIIRSWAITSNDKQVNTVPPGVLSDLTVLLDDAAWGTEPG